MRPPRDTTRPAACSAAVPIGSDCSGAAASAAGASGRRGGASSTLPSCGTGFAGSDWTCIGCTGGSGTKTGSGPESRSAGSRAAGSRNAGSAPAAPCSSPGVSDPGGGACRTLPFRSAAARSIRWSAGVIPGSSRTRAGPAPAGSPRRCQDHPQPSGPARLWSSFGASQPYAFPVPGPAGIADRLGITQDHEQINHGPITAGPTGGAVSPACRAGSGSQYNAPEL